MSVDAALVRWIYAGERALDVLEEAVNSYRLETAIEDDGDWLQRVQRCLLDVERDELVSVCAWLSRLGAQASLSAYDGDLRALAAGLESTRAELREMSDELVE